jgi:hypothetical protein
MQLPMTTGLRYREEHSQCKHRSLGDYTKIKRHYKVHKAFQCMGGVIKDIYINGEVHSYVCVQRKGIKRNSPLNIGYKEADIHSTNAIRVKFKPNDRKSHKAKHSK